MKPGEQKNFFENVLSVLMEKAKRAEIALLFMDGSHFVMGCGFLGKVWSRVRRHVLTFCGRKRYSVLGALDFVSKKVLTEVTDLYINADTVCQLLHKVAEEYQGRIVHIVLDNAKYQKCVLVRELAQSLGIALDYLPSYSPNLNLIERLWKYVKSELRVKFWNDYEQFKTRINELIDSTCGSAKERISRLITDKVQLFDGVKPVTGATMAPASRIHAAA